MRYGSESSLSEQPFDLFVATPVEGALAGEMQLLQAGNQLARLRSQVQQFASGFIFFKALVISRW